MSTSAKGKTSVLEQADEYIARRARETPKREEEAKETPLAQRFANIKENPFHKIVMQSDASPSEKQQAVAKALAFDMTKTREENAEQLAAFESFKEYLMAYRKEMAKEIIRLSDTEAFGELQKVFEDMNTSLLDFENTITPLVEILEAVNRLNMASDGAMFDVFKEIQEDKAEEERLAKFKEESQTKITGYENRINELSGDIAVLKQQRSWFGLGGIKQDALRVIAVKENEIEGMASEMVDIRTELEKGPTTRESQFEEFAVEKQKLRELLDLTSDQFKDRQESLVNAALTFVNTMDERTGTVLSHMETIRNQISNVDDVNGKMQKIFAVINEGVKDAEGTNKELTDQLRDAAASESEIDRIEREDRLRAINEHVEVTTSSKVDTLGTLGELQEESLNIRSMRETNRQQINSTRKMHSSGTAGVASRLSTVLTAVSSAALNEAKTTTQNTLKGMNAITQEIASAEAIKNATNLHVQNDEFAQAIEKLAGFKEIADRATEITRSAIEENKGLQRDMEETARELEQSIKQLKGVAADVMQGEELSNEEPAEKAEQLTPSFDEFKI
jgi:chromosome segregation ATPase